MVVAFLLLILLVEMHLAMARLKYIFKLNRFCKLLSHLRMLEICFGYLQHGRLILSTVEGYSGVAFEGDFEKAGIICGKVNLKIKDRRFENFLRIKDLLNHSSVA